jgi:hypothetical protein
MMRVRIANNRHPAEILQMTQAKFDVMPEGDSVHTLEILDNFEHAHMAVPVDECFELGGNAVKLLR